MRLFSLRQQCELMQVRMLLQAVFLYWWMSCPASTVQMDKQFGQSAGLFCKRLSYGLMERIELQHLEILLDWRKRA